MVMRVLTASLGSKPSQEMPLVQAGLDSLGAMLLPCASYMHILCIFMDDALQHMQTSHTLLSQCYPMVLVGAAGAVEVRNEIGKHLGLELPSTLVFDYPTVSSLCQFISTLAPAVSGRGQSPLQVS